MDAATDNWQDRIDPDTRWLLIGLGFLQGLAVYALLEWLPEDSSPSLQFLLHSLLLSLPWMLLVVAEDFRDYWLWALLAGYALILAGVAAYMGSQCIDIGRWDCDGVDCFSFCCKPGTCVVLVNVGVSHSA